MTEIDRLRVAAYVLCLREGQILLARYIGHGHRLWTLPGGGIDHAEHPYDAAVREVAEETGYQAAIDRLLGVGSQSHRYRHEGDEVHQQSVQIFYAGHVIGGELRHEVDGSTDQAGWFDLASVAALPRAPLVDAGLRLLDTLPVDGLSRLDQEPFIMVNVSRIRADEWPEMRELRLEALQDSPTAFVERYDESVAQPDEFWQGRVARGAHGEATATFVARADGRLVGKATCFVEAEITDHVSAHVVGVYVTPAWRGRPEVAERLLGAAIDWARKVPRADRIRLFVTETNLRAAAFYRRIGFTFTGATLPYPNDPSLVEHEMEYTA